MVSDHALTLVSQFLFLLVRQRTKRKRRTFAAQACDHCNRKEGRGRSAHSLLDAMLRWGRAPDLLLYGQVLLSHRRCGIAFQLPLPAFLPVEERALRRSARNRRWCSLRR